METGVLDYHAPDKSSGHRRQKLEPDKGPLVRAAPLGFFGGPEGKSGFPGNFS